MPGVYQKDWNALSYKIGQGTANVAIVGVTGVMVRDWQSQLLQRLAKQ